MITQTINLSQRTKGVPPVVHMVQNDTGRGIICDIDITLAATDTAIFAARKPSGYTIYDPATVNATTNQVEITITGQALAEAGDIEAQVQITSTAGIVSTFKFIIRVEEATAGAGIETSSEFAALAKMQQDFQTLKNGYDTAVAEVTTDTEIKDIRNKADGTKSTTAGAAVREQVTALQNEIDDLYSQTTHDINIDELNLWKNGSFEGGTRINESGTSERYGSYYPLDKYYIGTNPDTGAALYRTMPTITDETAATGTFSLKVQANNENVYGVLRGGRIKNEESGNWTTKVYACYGMHKIYVALKVKITAWAAGKCGVYAFGSYVGKRGTTNGWETISGIIENPNVEENSYFLVGAFKTLDDSNPANMTAYIDDVVIINLDKCPQFSKDQLDAAYKVQTAGTAGRYTSIQCLDEYSKLCSTALRRYGLKDTSFVTPSGQPLSDTDTGETTCEDLIKLIIAAIGNPNIARAMSIGYDTEKAYTPEEKNITMNNTLTSTSELAAAYYVLGAKGGSWNSYDDRKDEATAKCSAAVVEIEGYTVVMSVGDVALNEHQGGEDIIYKASEALKQLADICKKKIKGEATSDTVTLAECAAAVIIPQIPAAAGKFRHYDKSTNKMINGFEYIYSKQPTKKFMPASTTKMATALLADDFLNFEDMITYSIDDVATSRLDAMGSGRWFNPRHSMSVRDMINTMFIISSNQAATSIAREIGRRALVRKERI